MRLTKATTICLIAGVVLMIGGLFGVGLAITMGVSSFGSLAGPQQDSPTAEEFAESVGPYAIVMLGSVSSIAIGALMLLAGIVNLILACFRKQR